MSITPLPEDHTPGSLDPGSQPPPLLGGLTFKIADAIEASRALELRRQVYAKEYGHLPVDDFDRDAFHLIALESGGDVIATLRVVGPEQRPFDIEEFVDLRVFLPAGRIPAVVGRLCVRGDYRTIRRNSFVQIGMLKLMVEHAKKRGITDLILYTYLNLIQFYRGAFFKTLDITFEHPHWGTVHLMHLDLADLEKRHVGSQGPMARILFGPDLPNIVI